MSEFSNGISLAIIVHTTTNNSCLCCIISVAISAILSIKKVTNYPTSAARQSIRHVSVPRSAHVVVRDV